MKVHRTALWITAAVLVLAALGGAAYWFTQREIDRASLHGQFLQNTSFLVGVNYPWLDYGCDFGTNAWGHNGVSVPANAAVVDKDFADLEQHGVHYVRWFLFADGRAGLRFDSQGHVLGLTDQVFDDMDTAVSLARKHHIHLIFVIVDFSMLQPATQIYGVQAGGHAQIISDPAARQSFLDNAVKPVLQRYGRNGTIVAWEVINEPEWMMKIPLRKHGATAVAVEVMQEFVGQTVQYIHQYSEQVATLGSAQRKDLYLWTGSHLDFYQYHWYPYMAPGEPLNYPALALALDKPCIVGEFESTDPRRSVGTYLDDYLRDGYAGAFVWSYRAQDRATNFPTAAPDLRLWLQNHHGSAPSSSFANAAPELSQWLKQHSARQS